MFPSVMENETRRHTIVSFKQPPCCSSKTKGRHWVAYAREAPHTLEPWSAKSPSWLFAFSDTEFERRSRTSLLGEMAASCVNGGWLNLQDVSCEPNEGFSLCSLHAASERPLEERWRSLPTRFAAGSSLGYLKLRVSANTRSLEDDRGHRKRRRPAYRTREREPRLKNVSSREP